MGKLLFWVAVVIVIMFAIRLINHKKAQQRHNESQTPSATPNATANPSSNNDHDPKHVESMVRCEHCGVHLPRSDAVLMNEHLWCSTEHAKLGPLGSKRH